MSDNNSNGSNGGPSVTELVSGIVGDVQDLGMQHLALFRCEIQEDLRNTTNALISLAIGLAIAQVGAILLGMMCVQLLSYLLPNLSIWICYATVGAVISGLGTIGIVLGIRKLQTIDRLSRQAAQVMKEDARWLTKSK